MTVSSCSGTFLVSKYFYIVGIYDVTTNPLNTNVVTTGFGPASYIKRHFKAKGIVGDSFTMQMYTKIPTKQH